MTPAAASDAAIEFFVAALDFELAEDAPALTESGGDAWWRALGTVRSANPEHMGEEEDGGCRG